MTTKTDDRYRINQDHSSISEALWQVAKDYGLQNEIAIDEQAAVVRSLRAVLRSRSGPLTRQDIHDAFAKFDLRTPPRGYARDVIARLERLDR